MFCAVFNISDFLPVDSVFEMKKKNEKKERKRKKRKQRKKKKEKE